MQLSKQKRERCHHQLLLCMTCSVKQIEQICLCFSSQKRKGNGYHTRENPEGQKADDQKIPGQWPSDVKSIFRKSLLWHNCHDCMEPVWQIMVDTWSVLGGFSFCPIGIMFSKMLQLLATILATALGYFIHKYEGACFFKWDPSGTEMILYLWSSQRQFLGVDMEITRPNSEVIWKDIDIALSSAGLLAARVGGTYKFALPWLWRQRQ